MTIWIWIALPIVVAATGMGVAAAMSLVLLALLVAWITTLRGLLTAPAGPKWRLETIAASHFVEKVRWCMDRLGIDYQEDVWAGSLGAFYRGRTVPLLYVRTGQVTSRLGNSADILRYLWGSFGHREDAQFLKPTPALLEEEARLDRYGVAMQRWVYWHILPHRQTTLYAWGASDPATPWWQRLLIRGLFPLHRALMRRAFALSEPAHERVCADIERTLADWESRLENRDFQDLDFVDMTFCALSALWAVPEGFGAGKSEHVRLPDALVPESLGADQKRWRDAYPRVTAFIEHAFAEHR